MKASFTAGYLFPKYKRLLNKFQKQYDEAMVPYETAKAAWVEKKLKPKKFLFWTFKTNKTTYDLGFKYRCNHEYPYLAQWGREKLTTVSKKILILAKLLADAPVELDDAEISFLLNNGEVLNDTENNSK